MFMFRLTQIRRFGLKTGNMVSGPVRSPKEGENIMLCSEWKR